MKALMCALAVVSLLGSAACAQQYEWDRPGLTSQQRADIATQYLKLRQMTRPSDDGWDYTPMRTPQLQQDFHPLTFCHTTGPYGYRTTVCN